MTSKLDNFISEGGFLKSLRLLHGLSQNDLANILETNRINYLRREKDEAPMSFSEWIKISTHYGIDPMVLGSRKLSLKSLCHKKVKKRYSDGPLLKAELFHLFVQALLNLKGIKEVELAFDELKVSYANIINQDFSLNALFISDLVGQLNLCCEEKRIAVEIYRCLNHTKVRFCTNNLRDKNFLLKALVRNIAYVDPFHFYAFEGKEINVKERLSQKSRLKELRANGFDPLVLVSEFLTYQLKESFEISSREGSWTLQ